MEKIQTKKYLVDKTAHSCLITVVKNEEEIKLADAHAIIRATETRTMLGTNKYRYPVLEREYSLVVCNIEKFYQEPTIEYLENVDMFNLTLTFVIHGEVGAPITITDAEPKEIDLYGQWVFSLTKREEEKIKEATQK